MHQIPDIRSVVLWLCCSVSFSLLVPRASPTAPPTFLSLAVLQGMETLVHRSLGTRRVSPAHVVSLLLLSSTSLFPSSLPSLSLLYPSSIGYYIRQASSVFLGLLLAYLSVPVVQNLFSTRQMMNTSFDSLRIVNTYGAFGR